MRTDRSVSTTRHMSISIEGVLRLKKKITFCDNDDGSRMSDKEARAMFLEAKMEGKRVLPMSDSCYRFDYQTGCKGHIKSIKPTAEKMEEINNE